MTNIYKCVDAIEVEVEFTGTMLHKLDKVEINNFMKLEDQLLGLSQTNSVDGIFYLYILKNNDRLIARIFENGAFDGFFKNVGDKDVKIILNVEEVLPYRVYTLEETEGNYVYK